MTNADRVKAFKELYDLLNFYFENRYQPVESGFDFFKEVEVLCEKLDLDFEVFKEEFHLNVY